MNFNYAAIVFEDNTTLWWLKFLSHGFRHCYLIVFSDSHPFCVELNPMSNQVFVSIYNRKHLYSYIKNKNFIIIKIFEPILKPAPLSFFTCVEFIKRILGIHNRFIITPKKLYTALNNCRKKVLTSKKK